MTPLVLVHGFMGGSAQWADLYPELAQSHDVVALDLPGFGGNGHLPVINTIGGFADWVIGQLTDRGISKYHLLGHSMGGMIAQEIVRRDAARVARLVLYSTGAMGILPGRFETIAQSKARAKADGTEHTARRIAATWFLDHTTAAGYPGCADIAAQSADDAIPAGLDAMQAWSGTAYLPQIRAETLVLWGDGDRTYPWQQINLLWNSIPAARLCVIPGCAHAVHLEKPQVFASVLLDFLTPETPDVAT